MRFCRGLVELQPIRPNANNQARLKAYKRFLSLVAFVAPMLEQDLLLYTGDGADHPAYDENLMPQLVFNQRKSIGGPFVTVPDAHFVRARGYEKMRRVIDGARVPWDAKQSIAFWRGSSTGGHLGDGGDVTKNKRVQLCLAGGSDPDLVDARITRMVDCREGAGSELDALGVRGSYVTAVDHLRYRYLVSIDGWGGEWEGMYWKLYSGSLVLMVESAFEQWYSELLVPWEHYVPVKDDLSDLQERIVWCRNNDLTCRAIAERAVRLVRDHVNYAEAVRYTRRRVISVLS